MKLANIPPSLTTLPNWVVWKKEKRGGKETKVPYDAQTLAFAKSNDPNTWASFETAAEVAEPLFGSAYDGVGFMLHGTPFIGLDFDGVLSEGKPEPYVVEILRLLGNPYTEITPSGNGLRAFVECPSLPKGNRKFSNNQHGKYGAEIYSGNEGGRYLTVTGDRFSGDGIPKITADEIQLPYILASQICNDKFKRLWMGDLYMHENDHSRADQALCSMLARLLGNEAQKIEQAFSKSFLGQRQKWTEREDYRQRTIAKAISGKEPTEMPAPEPDTTVATSTWVEPMAEDAFCGLAGEFVRCIEPETEADRQALLANFLVMAGVLFGRNAYAVADGKRHYPNEYVLLVGDSGAGGRKGTATERSLPIFDKVDQNFYDHILNGLSTGEGLIKAAEPKDYEQGLSCRSYLVLLSEYASLLGVMKREGNTMSAVLRNAWDNAKLVVLTRKDPLKVDNVNLSLVAHITPNELLNTLDATERANGFANRHLIVAVRRSKLLPEGGNSDIDLNDIVTGLHRAVEVSRNHEDWDGRLTRTEEAKNLWAEVYPHLTRTRAGLSGALLSRAEAHVLRLSLLYALLDSAREIRVEHLRAALAFWDYCEASVGLIFGSTSGDPDGDKILEFMAQRPDGFALPTDISGGVFHRNKPADWIHAKMDALTRQGKVMPTTHKTTKGELHGWRIITLRQRAA